MIRFICTYIGAKILKGEKTMETKLCKHCQTEIPKKAKVCPNCKKKQGGIGKWIVIALVAVLLIGAMGSSDDSSNDTSSNNTGTVENNSDANINNTNEDVNSEIDNTIAAGESFEANGLKVTVNEINTNYTDYDDPYNMYAPESGYKYVRVSFTYENTGESDKYVSIYDYDCYADGTLCEQSYYFDNDFINGNISSGRNVSFATCYIVPVDATEIELEYTSNIWTSEKVIITIQ